MCYYRCTFFCRCPVFLLCWYRCTGLPQSPPRRFCAAIGVHKKPQNPPRARKNVHPKNAAFGICQNLLVTLLPKLTRPQFWWGFALYIFPQSSAHVYTRATLRNERDRRRPHIGRMPFPFRLKMYTKKRTQNRNESAPFSFRSFLSTPEHRTRPRATASTLSQAHTPEHRGKLRATASTPTGPPAPFSFFLFLKSGLPFLFFFFSFFF